MPLWILEGKPIVSNIFFHNNWLKSERIQSVHKLNNFPAFVLGPFQYFYLLHLTPASPIRDIHMYDVWRLMAGTEATWNSLANNRQTNFICLSASASALAGPFRAPNQIVLVTKGHRSEWCAKKLKGLKWMLDAHLGSIFFPATVESCCTVPAKWPALIKKHLIYAYEYALNRREPMCLVGHIKGDRVRGWALPLFTFTFRYTFCRWLFDMHWMAFWLAVWDWNRTCILKRISNYFRTKRNEMCHGGITRVEHSIWTWRCGINAAN